MIDGRTAPLLGVPIAVKDNLCTRGIRTTASSRMLESYVPPYDATVVARLTNAGAVVIGKTNCDEFAMGSSTEKLGVRAVPQSVGAGSHSGRLQRRVGCRRGGRPDAARARLGHGGSIRQPAALCGVVGLKPTYGRVSRYGLLAFASSLDQIGPLTRTVRDAALALAVIAGPDPADATSTSEPVDDYPAGLTGDIRGLRIGVPSSMLESGVDAEVLRACH